MQSPDPQDDMYGTGDGRDPDARLAPAPWFEAFAVALAFFTRLPVRPAAVHPLSACALAFAPVGALIGATVGIVFLLLDGLGLPALVAALLALGCGLVLTGALHEDGLADTTDALGRNDRTAALEIMRDSRMGAFGGLALVLSLGLRGAAIAVLPGWIGLAALIGAHAFSRAVLAVAMERLAPARTDGLGAAAGRPRAREAMQALGLGAAIALVAALLFAGLGAGLFALIVGATVGLGGLEVARRRFGGYTGDVLGALQQIVEAAMLIAFTAYF